MVGWQLKVSPAHVLLLNLFLELLGEYKVDARHARCVDVQFLDVLAFGVPSRVEALVVDEPVFTRGGVEVQTVIAAPDFHRPDLCLLGQPLLDFVDDPAVTDELSLVRREIRQAFPGRLPLQLEPWLEVAAVMLLEVGVQGFVELLGDGDFVVEEAVGLVLREVVEGVVDERAEARAVQFGASVGRLRHPECVLEPEVRRAGEVLLERGHRDLLLHLLHQFGLAERLEAMAGWDVPEGFLLGGDVLLE